MPPEDAGSPPKGTESLLSWVPKILGYLTALAALSAAIDGFLSNIKDASHLRLIGLSIATLGLGLLWQFVRKRLGPVSSFSSPARLKIGQRYLYGREDEVRILADRLKDYPLVFLIGESGAGKSSLLEKGLTPKLRETSFSLPVYLNHWGADWIEGPQRTLADALSQALDAGLRERLSLKGAIGSEQLYSILARLHDELGIQPVLLLDQFDDYQTRHREQFMRGPTRQLLRARDLVRDNPFWNDLADLLGLGKLRCVVVTRDDAQWGLESVRFQEPGFYLLPLLEREYAAAVLDTVAAEAGLVEAERGFRQLHDRLLRDLAPEGLVLPIQMKSVLQGLAELRPLSSAGYTREGALSGLEALSIARAIAQASRATGWTPSMVRGLLLTMVDPVSRQKTVPANVSQLLAALPLESREEAKLSAIMQSLRDDDIVRDRVDRDLGSAVWQLDHDYLCRGVLELNRRAQRWPLLLEESAMTFAAANGLRASWATLLKPSVQLRLLWERLCGRLKYGAARHYAAVSAFRLVLNFWLPAAGLGIWGVVAYPEWRAERLLREVGTDYGTTKEQAQALWAVGRESLRTRKSLLSAIFSRAPAPTDSRIARAVMSLEEPGASEVLGSVLKANCARIRHDSSHDMQCGALALELPPTQDNAKIFLEVIRKNQAYVGRLSQYQPLLREYSKGATLLADELSQKLEVERDLGRYLELSSDLLALRGSVSADMAERISGKILDNIDRSTDDRVSFLLPNLLEKIRDQLAPRDVDLLATKIALKMDCRNGPLDPFYGFAYSLALIADRLRSGQVEQAVGCMQARMLREPIESISMSQLLFPLSRFRARLDPKQRAEVSGFMAERFSYRARYSLSSSDAQFFSFVDDLDPAGQQRVARALVAARFWGSGFSGAAAAGVEDYAALGERLSPEAAEGVIRYLLELPSSSSGLSWAYSFRLGRNMTDPVRQEISGALLARLRGGGDSESSALIFQALGNLGKLPSGTGGIASDIALQRMRKSSKRPADVVPLALGIAALGGDVPYIAREEAMRLLIEIEKTSPPTLEMAKALGALGSGIKPPLQREALIGFLESARQLSDPPCGSAAPLVQTDKKTLSLIFEVVKWPTCLSDERNVLIKSLADALGVDYKGRPTRYDLWKIAERARGLGLHTEAPPVPPLQFVSSPYRYHEPEFLLW